MPKFVAVLRGVNVGKAKRVPMADFRALLEGLGYTQVTTLLNSGNAVFRAAKGAAAKHAADIAAAISDRLNIDVPVTVKSAAELAAMVLACPITAEAPHHSRLLVVFVQDAKALGALAAVESLVVEREEFALGNNAAYLLCMNGILESKAANALLGKVGKSITTRNWATVLKLNALANGPEA